MRRALLILLTAILASGTAACGSDDGGDSADTTTTTAAPETIPEDTQPDRTEERKELLIAPVLSSGGCPADEEGGEDGGEDGGESEAAPATDLHATADGIFCYELGDPVGDGNDLTDATLSETDGEFQVFTRVKPDSVDKLNELFNACFNAQPECPPVSSAGRGVVAFVWEDVVLHAPAIEAEDLAVDGFSLAGGLTERRARDLITLVNR
ncbi:MAG: hypothetical protein GX643_17860 [Acidimicrobiales bacterium]|nr:hypothetical protein [Acidimicrobiales bacterium]